MASAVTRAGVPVDVPVLAWSELGMHLTVGATLLSAKIFVLLLLSAPFVIGAAGVAGGTYVVHLEYESALETLADSEAVEDMVLGTGGVTTGIANVILDAVSGIINGWNIVVPFLTFAGHTLYAALRFFVVVIFANPQVQYFFVAWFLISVELFETTVDAANAVIETMRDVVDEMPLTSDDVKAHPPGSPEAAEDFLRLYDFLLALFVAFMELLIRITQFNLQIFLPILYVFIRAILPAMVGLVAPFLTLLAEVLNIIASPAVQRALLICVELLEMFFGLTAFICSAFTIGGFVLCVSIATALTVFLFMWEKIIVPMLCVASSFTAGCLTAQDCQNFKTSDCPPCSGKSSPLELEKCQPPSIVITDDVEFHTFPSMRPGEYKRAPPAMCTAYCTPHTYFYGKQLFDRDADFRDRAVDYSNYNHTILGWNATIGYLGDFYGLTSRYPGLATSEMRFNGSCPREGLICAQNGWYCKKNTDGSTRWAFSPCLVNRCPYASPWLSPAQQAVAIGDTGLSQPGFDITQIELWDSLYGVDNSAACATAARTSALPEHFAPMRHCSDRRHALNTNGPCCLFPTSLFYTEDSRVCDPRVQLPEHCYGPPAQPGSPPCCLNADDHGYSNETYGPRLCQDGQSRGPVPHCADSRYNPTHHKSGCCLTGADIFTGAESAYPNRGGVTCSSLDPLPDILECNDLAYVQPANPADGPLCCRHESDILHNVSVPHSDWGGNPYVRKVGDGQRSKLQSLLYSDSADLEWFAWATGDELAKAPDSVVREAVNSSLNRWTARVTIARPFVDPDVLPHCDALHSGVSSVRWMEFVAGASGANRVRLHTVRPALLEIDNSAPSNLDGSFTGTCPPFTTCCRLHPPKTYGILRASGQPLPAEKDTRCGPGAYWSAFNGRRCVADVCNRANASLVTHEAYPSGHQQCVEDANVWSNAEMEYRALRFKTPLIFTTCHNTDASPDRDRKASERALAQSMGVAHCESSIFGRHSPSVQNASEATFGLGATNYASTSTLWAFRRGPFASAVNTSYAVSFPEPMTLSPLIPTPRRAHRDRLSCCLPAAKDPLGTRGVPCSPTLGSQKTAPLHCMQPGAVYTGKRQEGEAPSLVVDASRRGTTQVAAEIPLLAPGMMVLPNLSPYSYVALVTFRQSTNSTTIGCCWHASETWGKNLVMPWQGWISHCFSGSRRATGGSVAPMSKCAAYDRSDASLARFAASPFASRSLPFLRDVYERYYRVQETGAVDASTSSRTIMDLKESSQRVSERAEADVRLWNGGAETFLLPCCRDAARDPATIAVLIGANSSQAGSQAHRLSTQESRLFAAIHDADRSAVCTGPGAAGETAPLTAEAAAVTGACEPDVACFAGSSGVAIGMADVLTPANARQCTPFPVGRPWSNQSMCCGLDAWQPALRGPLPWHRENRGYIKALRCTALERATALRRVASTRHELPPQRALAGVRRCSDVADKASGDVADEQICCKRNAELCLSKARSNSSFPLISGPRTPLTQRWRFCQYGCKTMAARYRVALDCYVVQVSLQLQQNQAHNRRAESDSMRRVVAVRHDPVDSGGCIRQGDAAIVGYRTQERCVATRLANSSSPSCSLPSGDARADLARELASGQGTCIDLRHPSAATWIFRPNEPEMSASDDRSAVTSLRRLARAWRWTDAASLVDIPPEARREIARRWQEHVLRSRGAGHAISSGSLSEESVLPGRLAQMRLCEDVEAATANHIELTHAPLVRLAERLCAGSLPSSRTDASALAELRATYVDLHLPPVDARVAQLHRAYERESCKIGGSSASQRRGLPCTASAGADADEAIVYSNFNERYFAPRAVTARLWYALPWCSAWPQTNYGGCRAPRVAAWVDGVFKVAPGGDCFSLPRPGTSLDTVFAHCPGERKCCRGNATSEVAYDIRPDGHATQQLQTVGGTLQVNVADAWANGARWLFSEAVRGGWTATWSAVGTPASIHLKIVAVSNGRRFFMGLIPDALSAQWGASKPSAWLCHESAANNARRLVYISNELADPPGVGGAPAPSSGVSCTWIMRATQRSNPAADVGELRPSPQTAPLASDAYDSAWPLYQCAPNHTFNPVSPSALQSCVVVTSSACQEDELRVGDGCVSDPNYVRPKTYFGATGQIPSTHSAKIDACLHSFPFPRPTFEQPVYDPGNNSLSVRLGVIMPNPTNNTRANTSTNFFTADFCSTVCCAPMESDAPEQGWTVSGTKWTVFARNRVQTEVCAASSTNDTVLPPPSYGTCLNCDGTSTQTDLGMTTFVRIATETRSFNTSLVARAATFRDGVAGQNAPYTADPAFPYVDNGNSTWDCTFAKDKVPSGFSHLAEGAKTFAETQIPAKTRGNSSLVLWDKRPVLTFDGVTHEADAGPTDTAAYPTRESVSLISCRTSVRVPKPYVWQRNVASGRGAYYDTRNLTSPFYKLSLADRKDAQWGVVFASGWTKVNEHDTEPAETTFAGEWMRAGPHRALSPNSNQAGVSRSNGAWESVPGSPMCDILDDGCVRAWAYACTVRSTSAGYVRVAQLSMGDLSADGVGLVASQYTYLPASSVVAWSTSSLVGHFELCQLVGTHDGQNEASDPHWFRPQTQRLYGSNPWYHSPAGGTQFPASFVKSGSKVTVAVKTARYADGEEITVPLAAGWNDARWNDAGYGRPWPYVDVWWHVGGVAGGARLRPHADCSLSVVAGSEPESSAYVNQLLGLRPDGTALPAGVDAANVATKDCTPASDLVAQQKAQVDRDAQRTEDWMASLRMWIYSRTTDVPATPEPLLNNGCANTAMKVYTQLVSHRMRLRNLEAYLESLDGCTAPVHATYTDYFVNPEYVEAYEASVQALIANQTEDARILPGEMKTMLDRMNTLYNSTSGFDCHNAGKKLGTNCIKSACGNRDDTTTCPSICTADPAEHYCCDSKGRNSGRGNGNPHEGCDDFVYVPTGYLAICHLPRHRACMRGMHCLSRNTGYPYLGCDITGLRLSLVPFV